MTGREATLRFAKDLKSFGYFTNGKGRKITADIIRAELAGKNLACFCGIATKFCHVNILLKIANRPAL